LKKVTVSYKAKKIRSMGHSFHMPALVDFYGVTHTKAQIIY